MPMGYNKTTADRMGMTAAEILKEQAGGASQKRRIRKS